MPNLHSLELRKIKKCHKKHERPCKNFPRVYRVLIKCTRLRGRAFLRGIVAGFTISLSAQRSLVFVQWTPQERPNDRSWLSCGNCTRYFARPHTRVLVDTPTLQSGRQNSAGASNKWHAIGEWRTAALQMQLAAGDAERRIALIAGPMPRTCIMHPNWECSSWVPH